MLVIGAWAWFLYGQLNELRSYPWQIAPASFIFGVGWGAVYFAGLGLCWTLLLRTMGGAARRVGLVAGTNLWLTTMLSRYIPGNVWHIVGRMALAERINVKPTQIMASATVEQMLVLMGAVALFGLCVPFWRGGTGSEIWLLLLIPIGLILLHPRVMGAALLWGARRFGHTALIWPYRFGEMVGLLFAYAGAKLAAGVALFILLRGLTSAGPGEFAALIGAAALSWVIGYVSLLSPSGLGVREAALTALLAQLYPLPVAIVASLVYRLVLTLGEVVAVVISLALVRLPLAAFQIPTRVEAGGEKASQPVAKDLGEESL